MQTGLEGFKLEFKSFSRVKGRILSHLEPFLDMENLLWFGEEDLRF